MRTLLTWTVVAVAAFLSCATSAPARSWEVYYAADVLPSDPSLGSSAWVATGDVSMCSSDGSVLRIADDRTDARVYFSRFAAPAESPITVEARVRTVSGEGYATLLYVGTPSYTYYVSLYPDSITIDFGQVGGRQTYESDLTAFRTIRLATAVQGGSYASYVWLDGVLVAQGTSTPGGNYQDVMFGVPWGITGESYWDYVAYSAEFLPIPEPSSLLALACGSAGIVGAAVRRRGR